MKTFNFRDVTNRIGISCDSQCNWAIGRMLRELACKHGIEPEYILTEKTNPNPSVDAPHCIAHYPISMFDEACEVVLRWWGDRSRQLDIFGDSRLDFA